MVNVAVTAGFWVPGTPYYEVFAGFEGIKGEGVQLCCVFGMWGVNE